MVGFVVGGAGVGILLRDGLGYPLAGEVVYWAGIVGFLAIWLGTSTPLFDERDRALERRASHLALLAFVPVLVGGASLGRVLPLVSDYALPAAVWPALYALGAVYVTFGAIYVGLRFGR